MNLIKHFKWITWNQNIIFFEYGLIKDIYPNGNLSLFYKIWKTATAEIVWRTHDAKRKGFAVRMFSSFTICLLFVSMFILHVLYFLLNMFMNFEAWALLIRTVAIPFDSVPMFDSIFERYFLKLLTHNNFFL